MRYVAAAMLLSLAGEKISKENIRRILASVGIECEEDKVQLVVGQLQGKDIDSLLSEGVNKLGSVPSGGGVAIAAGGDQAVTATDAPAAEAPKEEKKDEPEDESDDDMGFGLFD